MLYQPVLTKYFFYDWVKRVVNRFRKSPGVHPTPDPLVHIPRTHHQMTPLLLMRCYSAFHRYDYSPAFPYPPSLSRLSCSLHHHCSVPSLQVLPDFIQQYFPKQPHSSNNRHGQRRQEDHCVESESNCPNNISLQHASIATATYIHRQLPTIAFTATQHHS